MRRLLLLSMFMLGACAKTPGAAVQVADAWSPLAPPGATTVAIYADISASHADSLTSISTPLAASAQLHASVEENGMMKMRAVPQLDLKEGETVHLSPGGMHVMLMGVQQPLAVDASIPLVFHFARAGDIAVTARVRAAER